MINKIIYSLTGIFFIFVFVIFFRGLSNSSLYTPTTNLEIVPEFSAKTFYEKKWMEMGKTIKYLSFQLGFKD